MINTSSWMINYWRLSPRWLKTRTTPEASLLHASVSSYAQRSVHAFTEPVDEHPSDHVPQRESIFTCPTHRPLVRTMPPIDNLECCDGLLVKTEATVVNWTTVERRQPPPPFFFPQKINCLIRREQLKSIHSNNHRP